MKLSRVVVIVTVTAAIVYFGLNMMLPRSGKGHAPEATAATTEEVFGAETPAASGDAPAAEAAASDAPAATTSEETAPIATEASAAPAASEPTEAFPETASETSSASAPASAEPKPVDPSARVSTLPTMSDADARRIAENVGRDEGRPVDTSSMAAAAAPAAAGDSSSLSEEEARRIAANVASEVASRVAGEAAPAPKPAAKPKPAPKPAAVAEAPKPAKPVAAKSAAASVAKAPTGKVSNGADVITSWWTKPGAASPDRLALVYAGEASSEKAVVLLFNNAVDPSSAAANIKLVNARGATPSGSWSSGTNPRVLAFKGVAPGRYTVILRKEFSDASGKQLGSEMVGPVYVH